MQVKLEDRQRNEIVIELRTIQSLRECLDVVDIIIGFLSSTGDEANKKLKTYLNVSLKMKDDRFRSKKVNYISLHVNVQCVIIMYLTNIGTGVLLFGTHTVTLGSAFC